MKSFQQWPRATGYPRHGIVNCSVVATTIYLMGNLMTVMLSGTMTQSRVFEVPKESAKTQRVAMPV